MQATYFYSLYNEVLLEVFPYQNEHAAIYILNCCFVYFPYQNLLFKNILISYFLLKNPRKYVSVLAA